MPNGLVLLPGIFHNNKKLKIIKVEIYVAVNYCCSGKEKFAVERESLA